MNIQMYMHKANVNIYIESAIFNRENNEICHLKFDDNICWYAKKNEFV